MERVYFGINESGARTANDLMSFREYKTGSRTAEYSAYEHERKEFDPEVYRKCEEYLKTDRRSKWERPEVVGER